MDIIFVNEQNYGEKTIFVVNDGVFQKKTNDGRTTWIIQKIKKKFSLLKNECEKTNNLKSFKKRSFLY